MTKLKKGYTEHHLNETCRELVKELNNKIKIMSNGETPPVKFQFGMDSEGIGGINVTIKYSEGLYGCNHSIETEDWCTVKKSDISKQVIEFHNQIITELQYYKITL